MLGLRHYFYKGFLIESLFAIFSLLFLCECLIYYVVLVQCGYPDLDPYKADSSISPPKSVEKPVKVMFIADTHLLGSRNGHWFDKLRREWQMHKTFQASMFLHAPDVVFILGDLFDEGLWSSAAEFNSTIDRFHTLFKVPKNTLLYVVPGNHDMGFHYAVTPYSNRRFIDGMKSPNVRRVSIRGNHFVLVNSMALEGDGCFLCKPVEDAITRISKHLKCAKGFGLDCNKSSAIKRYSRPILLQHFPMYRESDALCAEMDQAPDDIKNIKFRERWECLSWEASEQLLDILKPRLIVNGHTHHGCRKWHGEDTLEVTVPSFSWRNKNNPSFMLGIFTPDNYAISKCYMPVESTVILMYIIGVVVIVTYLMYRIKQRLGRFAFRKRHQSNKINLN